MIDISTYATFAVAAESIIPARPPLFRVLHDREMGALWRPGLPEVHPFSPAHHTLFTEAWQHRSFNMNSMSREKWTSVYSYKIAFTNDNGYGDPGDPRRNYIMGENLREEFPKVEALVCGGAVLTGVVSGDVLVVHTLNGRERPPEIIEPWEMFDAVTVDRNGVPRMFPQGDGHPVKIPLLADRTRYPLLTFPMSKLRRLRDDEPIPDPYL
jgi:hypothetical protein